MSSLVQRLKERTGPLFDTELLEDAETNTLWIIGHYTTHARISHALALSVLRIHDALRQELDMGRCDIKVMAYASSDPQAFNYGGDLMYFAQSIMKKDRMALMRYGRTCIDIIANNTNGLDDRLVTLSLVEGEAMGGGLEQALSCQMTVAAEKTLIGFPEIRFGLYPGMGGISFMARQNIATGCNMLFEGAKVNVCDDTIKGMFTAIFPHQSAFIDTRNMMLRMNKRSLAIADIMRQHSRISRPSKEEMLDIVERWSYACMEMSDRNVKQIQKIADAQVRKVDMRERSEKFDYIKKIITSYNI